MVGDLEFRLVMDIEPFTERILSVYRATFTLPPYNDSEERVQAYPQLLSRFASRRDFRCALALDDDELLGFAFGYRGEPGQYWHDMVRAHLGPELSHRWFDDAFEFVEFAVHPNAQAHGIGSRIHDTLLKGLPYPIAVASTILHDNPALDFYLHRGWIIISDALRYSPDGEPNAVIGRDLDKGSND